MSENTPDATVNVNVDDQSQVDTNAQAQTDDHANLLPEEIAELLQDDQANEATDTDNGGADTDNAADVDIDVTVNHPATDTTADTTDTVDIQSQLADFAQRESDIDTRFEQNVEALRELANKYTDGEIGEGDYQAEKARLDREARKIEFEEQALLNQKSQVQTQADAQQAQIQNDFTSAADAFLDRPENKDVFVAGSPELTALDQQIQILSQTLPPTTTYAELFDKARSVVATYMNLPSAGGEAQQPQKANVPQPTIPPNLGQMQAVVNNSVDDKFAHIDKLSGLDYDRALERLSDAELTEYMQKVQAKYPMKNYRDLKLGDVITVNEPCTITVLSKGKTTRVVIETETGAVTFPKKDLSLRQLTQTHKCQISLGELNG